MGTAYGDGRHHTQTKQEPSTVGYMRAHIFRRNKVNHAVVTMRGHVRTNGRSLTICAQRVDDSFQRRPNGPASCDRCLVSMTGLFDVLDTDYDYSAWDDRTGRWA